MARVKTRGEGAAATPRDSLLSPRTTGTEKGVTKVGDGGRRGAKAAAETISRISYAGGRVLLGPGNIITIFFT